jgi:hypothetical protein
MGKHYRKKGSYRRGSSPNPLGFLILFLCIFLYNYWKIIIPICLLIFVAIWLYSRHKKQVSIKEEIDTDTNASDSSSHPSHQYSTKESFLSNTEKAYFLAIKEIAGSRYTVQPQVNLASIIDKTSHSRYRNELFRNIDFGIFDENYKLLVLIEINDQTHNQDERKARDKKVKEICTEAGIPLITFWTKYGINPSYIKNRLAEYLPLVGSLPTEESADNYSYIST